MKKLIQLTGNESVGKILPERCPECTCNQFYKQNDFKRSIGISLVVAASVLTCVFLYLRFSWVMTWSPMLVVLLLDFCFRSLSPVVALCYGCERIFRGLNEKELAPLDAFDLELYDRIHYQESQKE